MMRAVAYKGMCFRLSAERGLHGELLHLVAFAAYPHGKSAIPFLPRNPRRVTVRIVEAWLRSHDVSLGQLIGALFGEKQIEAIYAHVVRVNEECRFTGGRLWDSEPKDA